MVAQFALTNQVSVRIRMGVLTNFYNMNEAEAKNQAAIALKELNKALLLLYPFRNEGWALDFVDEVNNLSILY